MAGGGPTEGMLLLIGWGKKGWGCVWVRSQSGRGFMFGRGYRGEAAIDWVVRKVGGAYVGAWLQRRCRYRLGWLGWGRGLARLGGGY